MARNTTGGSGPIYMWHVSGPHCEICEGSDGDGGTGTGDKTEKKREERKEREKQSIIVGICYNCRVRLEKCEC